MRKHILNLGAGVQSTALYLMSIGGEVQRFDHAVFADTQEEPDDVYKHLEWLESLGGPKIIRATAGKLGDCVIAGTDCRGNRRKDGVHFSSIPAYVQGVDGKGKGIGQRQCTKEFKVDVVERVIRREIYGVDPGRPLPKGAECIQYMGLSFDEPRRVIRVKQRYSARPKQWRVEFPLFDLEMTRGDCRAYLKDRVPHAVPRSACVFCPYKTNAEWRELRDNDPVGWERACQVDEALRTADNCGQASFIHRSYTPLSQADLRTDGQKTGQMGLFVDFDNECEGMCGV
jgi:hypothetical protein